MIETPLTRMLEIRHPVLLAPMGNIAGGALATAVSAAGGLGLVGGGYGDPDWVRTEMDRADLSICGVGFITWAQSDPTVALKMALERKPKAVFLSFGDPSPYLPAIREAGSLLICQVQRVEDAKRAADLGADVIVAQGTEAGGHGAGRSTLPLVPAVVDAVRPVPVVAAGGIADGRGLAAALMLGAAGAVIGTRFMATPESLISDRAKARMMEEHGGSTLRTRVFDIIRGYDWPAPYTGRALANRFTARWHGREEALAAELETAKTRYQTAMAEGDFDEGLIFCGEALDLVRAVTPAAEVLEALMAETRTALGKGAQLLGG